MGSDVSESRRHDFNDWPIAVIGMACRLPGAENLDEYWNLLESGTSAITELPPDRLNRELYFNPEKGVLGKTYSTLGGVVPNVPLDRTVCPVTDDLITSVDAAHVNMLGVVATAVRHAGMDPMAMPTRNTGVFIGHARGGPLIGDVAYSRHVDEVMEHLPDVPGLRDLPENERRALVGGIMERVRREKVEAPPGCSMSAESSTVAGVISQAFGLTGPFMAVDGACASSLMALAVAARALHHERVDMALVGGASFSSWFSLVVFSHAQAVSSTGSFPFDARADGFISSDGYAALVIKSLPKALADGDTIHGVIRGLGMSSDGRGKSLWAPRKEGQVEAIRRAYECGANPAHVQYVEAHGTSTQLGDATELESLTTVLGKLLPAGAKIPIASVKANIGHTREAAGLAGLVKALLAMSKGVVPQAANYETPNPQIPWKDIPFYVPTSPTPWPAPEGRPRCAAVDAFGIGGLNVHVVVEDWPQGSSVTKPLPGMAVPRIVVEDPDEDAIAIIGRGAIFPGARTLAAYWEMLCSGRDPKVTAPVERWGLGSPALGGFITDFEYDWKKHKIPPRQLEAADPLQFMLLDATDQALHEAGLDKRAFDRRRTGVIVGTCFGGDFSSQLNIALRLPEFHRVLTAAMSAEHLSEAQMAAVGRMLEDAFMAHNHALHDETGSYTASTLASRIARTLDLMGGALAVDAGGSSSLAAVGASVDLLLSRACDLIVCAGGQRNMSKHVFERYAAQGYLAKGSPRAGFDQQADGLVPGEGAGVLVLKRLGDARRDGDPIHGIIRGYGASTRAGSFGSASREAMERATRSAHVALPEVALVESAGFGIPDLDAEEVRAVTDLYGPARVNGAMLLGSLAAQIGYSQGASGMASLLKTTLTLEHGQIPASPGLTRPVPALAEQASKVRVVLEATPLKAPVPGDVLLAGVNSFALRGLAYHVLLEAPSAAGTTPDSQIPSWRTVRLGAQTMEELSAQIFRSQHDAAALFERAGHMGWSARDQVRLAIVADGPETLAKKLKLSAEQTGNASSRSVLEEQGIFGRELTAGPPRVAWMFSGQGSQYAGMLRELVQQCPAAASALKEIEATMARLGHPTFADVVWENPAALGADLWRTQLAVLLGDTLMHSTLQAMGLRPDVISAHSYGEYAALVAAGAWTLEDAIGATKARCDIIAACTGIEGVLLATTATAEIVVRMSRECGHEVWIANINAPDQIVIGGRATDVAEVETRLKAEGFEAKLLPVARPFHTPLMAAAKATFREALEKIHLRPPRVPFFSSVTNRYIADPDDIRDNLVEQLTQPVRYVDLIRRLCAGGVTALVEVGPRQILTRLHRSILTGSDVAIIASDHPKRPGIEPLLRVQALLDCAGAEGLGQSAGDGPAAIASAQHVPLVKHKIVHFDATVHRRERMRKAGEATSEKPVPQAKAGRGPMDELETFLVNFVCEQTGYPAEIVDLDADLEADLGIDSIKKAQLFGELREHFDIQVTGTVSLADFPTLRHVVEFLRTAKKKEGGGLAEAPKKLVPLADRAVPTRLAAPNGQPTAAAQDVWRSLNVMQLAGTPYEMGLQHGRTQFDAIHHVLERFTALMGPRLERIGILYDVLGRPETFVDAEGLEELKGLADGLKMDFDSLIAYNVGLGLYSDYVPGCSQFAITSRCNGSEGMIHGANEDWSLALVITQTLKRVVQVRRPLKGIPHVMFSICGQLGGLNGMNQSGVAVSSTLLLDRMSRDKLPSGWIHTVLVRQILEHATDVESAVEIVRKCERTGAWSLCISHAASDQLCYLEYDGTSLQVRTGEDRVASTNHCLAHEPLMPVPEHSQFRMKRLLELMDDNAHCSLTVARGREILRDRFDLGRGRITDHPTMNTIRRTDTQMSVVMKPALGEFWVTEEPVPGKVDGDHYHQLKLAELFEAICNPPVPEQADVKKADDDSGEVMGRFVMRMVDAPLPTTEESKLVLHGPVLILGANASAQALRQRLETACAVIVDLPVGENADDTLAVLDRTWQQGPAPHLFIMTARDEEAVHVQDEEAWQKRRAKGVMLPCLVCQRWLKLVTEAGMLPSATLFAATALGGEFGFSGSVRAVEGGAITGLFKALRREFEGLRVKVVDAPHSEPAKMVAEAICREFSGGSREVEVGYVRGRRRIVRAVPRNIVAPAGGEIPRGGTWVVTGGGGGISAVVARELGSRFGLKVHLIGRSPAPQIEDSWRGLSESGIKQLKAAIAAKAHHAGRDPAAARREVEKALEIDQTMRTLADAGVAATYHSCDVADRAALNVVLQRIRATDGPIQGIIHGAGVEMASRFDRKTRGNIAATMAAKVDGAAALMALTAQDPLAYFVGFGSVSGRFGGQGQTDYSMASDMLAKLIGRFRAERPDCASVAFHWPAWGEVGMAMRPESRLVLEMGEQSFLPPLEGVEHLIAELQAGAPEAEVLLTGTRSGRLDLDGILPSADERQAYARRSAPLAGMPLVSGLHDLREGRHLNAELRFDPERDIFLIEHRHRGVPILPACVGIESLVEAGQLMAPERTVTGVRDIDVLRGFRFFADRPQDACVRAVMGEAGVRCELMAHFYDREGRLTDPNRVYLSGTVELADHAEVILPDEAQPPDDKDQRWMPMEYADQTQAHDMGRVYIGPSMRCVLQLTGSEKGGWARLVAPPRAGLSSAARPGGWVVPAALLDGCFQACGAFAYTAFGQPPMPRSLGRLRFGRQPRDGESCIIGVKFKGHTEGHVLFDFQLRGDDGQVILHADSFQIVLAPKP